MKDESKFQHGSAECTGVLLTNLGTPDAPTIPALRRYLYEFLWDPRVIDTPRWIWWFALHGVILRIRPKKSAAMYQRVWTEEGSPLLVIAQRQCKALQHSLEELAQGPVKVALAMRYGEPTIEQGMEELRQAGARRILVLPLYPQYSATTTASTFDEIAKVLKSWRWLPELRFINDYCDDDAYIDAIVAQVKETWDAFGQVEKLLFSFHGLPKQYLLDGDPYHCHCQKTARLVSERLGLEADQWLLSFQSRVGPKEWLKPYTEQTLRQWGKKGVKSVQVICPGFPTDCLETLDEIAVENRDVFLEAGGEDYRYIPALNDTPEHMQALAKLVARHAQGWPEFDPARDEQKIGSERNASAERARAMGADK